jgi:hypothetical protein
LERRPRSGYSKDKERIKQLLDRQNKYGCIFSFVFRRNRETYKMTVTKYGAIFFGCGSPTEIKKKGRELDGVVWDQYPNKRAADHV